MSVNAGLAPMTFADRGLRCTRQRRAIYKALSATDCHPTADQLFRQVCRWVPKVSLATVYNTLEAFCRAGLAVKLPGNGASARYDAALHNHAHTRCDKTGAVRDVPEQLSTQLMDQLPQDVLEKIETHLGFNIRQVQIELVGEYQG